MNVSDSDEFEREAKKYQCSEGFQLPEKAVVANKKSRQELPNNRFALLKDQDTGGNDESQTKGQVTSASPSTGSLRTILSLTQRIEFENFARKSLPIEATAIFTTGENKIVYRDNELINVRDACSEFSQKSNGCQWSSKHFKFLMARLIYESRIWLGKFGHNAPKEALRRTLLDSYNLTLCTSMAMARKEQFILYSKSAK